MTEPRYPHLLANALARRPSRDPKPVPVERSADEIALVQHTLDRLVARRRARVVVGGGVLALAAALGITWPWLSKHSPEGPSAFVQPELGIVASSKGQGTSIVSGGSSVELDAEAPLAPGSRILVGPAEPAILSLSTGSRVSLEPGSDVTLAGQGRSAIFKIGAGALRADVAKLAPADRFVVRTFDSEVEVRGTSFRVGVVPAVASCGDGTTTRVKVYEGTVVVRRNGHEQSIQKGDEWPGGCEARMPAAAMAPPAEGRAEPTRSTARASSSHPDVSDLGAQNDQFADAMILKRRGEVLPAIAAFDRFLAMHPASHLAENAAAERMKLLATTDQAAARVAARQYLQKYPSGFARDDARSLLARPTPP